MSEIEWMEIFAGNLQSLMVETGFSQSYLARESGINQGTISRYLAGTQMPSIKSIVNMAYAMNCDIVDLIDFGDTID